MTDSERITALEAEVKRLWGLLLGENRDGTTAELMLHFGMFKRETPREGEPPEFYSAALIKRETHEVVQLLGKGHALQPPAGIGGFGFL